MNVTGPIRYTLTCTPNSYEARCPQGTSKFSGIATNDKPKLYIASYENIPLYVGITKQTMSTRLRMGFNAKGESGYHGYRWRHTHTKVDFDIWCQLDATEKPKKPLEYELETVEAEVVFLIRRDLDQWPLSQTEIHFHESNETHRRIAAEIWKTFKARGPVLISPPRLATGHKT